MQTADTQKQRLLNLLQTRKRVPVWYLIAPRPQGLGIAQYNARIYDLRHEGHNILNKTDDNGHTYFELAQEGQQDLFDAI